MSEPFKLVEIACADLPAPHAREHCRQCSYPTGYLARYIHRNGTVALRWVCDWCEDYKTTSDLPRALVLNIDELPIRADNRLTYGPVDLPACMVCGEDAEHAHHWAPQAIFPDWPYELVVPLCVTHHNEWHARMRTHGLRWPHELTDAA